MSRTGKQSRVECKMLVCGKVVVGGGGLCENRRWEEEEEGKKHGPGEEEVRGYKKPGMTLLAFHKHT